MDSAGELTASPRRGAIFAAQNRQERMAVQTVRRRNTTQLKQRGHQVDRLHQVRYATPGGSRPITGQFEQQGHMGHGRVERPAVLYGQGPYVFPQSHGSPR